MENIVSCCSCFGNTVTLNNCTNPTPTKCGGCLTLGRIIVGCENSIAPCDTDSTLKIPFDCFCFPCTTPNFKILNQSSIKYATIESIDKTGLTIRPDGTGVANSKVEIAFKAVCEDGCETKTDYGSVVIYLKDVCKGVLCGDGEVCNQCTGNCDNITIDLATTMPTVTSEENTSGFDI